VDGRVWKCYSGQTVGDELQCLPYTRFPKTPKHNIFTLKTTTEVSAETTDNSQHSMQLNPKLHIELPVTKSMCKNLPFMITYLSMRSVAKIT
jgi:hypothetical protein